MIKAPPRAVAWEKLYEKEKRQIIKLNWFMISPALPNNTV